MGRGELVRRDLTGEVREDALLTEKTKKQLSEFMPTDYSGIQYYQHADYYKIPDTKEKLAVAMVNIWTREVPPSFIDKNNVEWTVVAIVTEENTLRRERELTCAVKIPRTIEYIVTCGKYACHGIPFDVDKDNQFYQSRGGALLSKDGSELFSYVSETYDKNVLLGVKSIGYLKISSNEPIIDIPATVTRIDTLNIKCQVLRFEGKLQELRDLSYVKAEKIYINQSLRDIAEDKRKMLFSVKYDNNDIFHADIITKKPVLSPGVPAAPGFISLTRVDNDEYEYINPSYIIKMSSIPESFEKYDGNETGTRILYAAHGSERAIAVDYYEKLLDVDTKIKEAQEALAQSIGGLAGLLEKVNDLYNLSQDRF